MKPPKLYTSRRKRKRPARRRSGLKPAAPALRDAEVRPALSRRMNEMRTLSRQIHTYASKMDQWLGAVTNLSQAMKDKQALHDVLSALSQVKPGKKTAPSARAGAAPTVKKSPLPAPPKPFSKDGDSLYDLLNAPMFPELIDKVMKNKKKWR